MIESFNGPADPPSPVISVVMPWKILEGTLGLTRMDSSDCPSMSMNPGATTIPAASTVWRAAAPSNLPIAVMCPSWMPTSAEYHGDPVPSMTRPLRMTTSYNTSSWARRAEGRHASSRYTRARAGRRIMVSGE